jgi:subtilisin family serine protease
MGRITGVAPGARIMAVRVGGAQRQFWRAMEFACANGAHVISMSMSWKYPDGPDYPEWRRHCEGIRAAGVLHANSIGNQGHLGATHPVPYNIATPGNCPPPWLHPDQPSPAGRSSAVGCGATNSADELAYTSGRGPAAWERGQFTDYPYARRAKPGLLKPDLCAPGPGTWSCNWQYGAGSNRPYASFGGTSAATPHVAGCMALLVEACRKAGQPVEPERIQEALERGAVPVVGQTAGKKENHFGAGRVDVHRAYLHGKAQGWW